MRRDLIIGLLVSICFHAGMGWGPQLWARIFPAKEVRVVQKQTAELTLWTPPPIPDIPPDLTQENQLQTLTTIAPPSLLDVPGNPQPDSFTEVMAPPPPPNLGKPDASMMVVPKGPPGNGQIQNNLGQIFNLKDLDQNPEVRGIQEAPVYPPDLKRQGITGTVTVQFVVESDGSVDDAKAIKSTDSRFENSAIEAVQKWKFRPGRKGGNAVRTRMEIPISFNLDDD